MGYETVGPDPQRPCTDPLSRQVRALADWERRLTAVPASVCADFADERSPGNPREHLGPVAMFLHKRAARFCIHGIQIDAVWPGSGDGISSDPTRCRNVRAGVDRNPAAHPVVGVAFEEPIRRWQEPAASNGDLLVASLPGIGDIHRHRCSGVLKHRHADPAVAAAEAGLLENGLGVTCVRFDHSVGISRGNPDPPLFRREETGPQQANPRSRCEDEHERRDAD